MCSAKYFHLGLVRALGVFMFFPALLLPAQLYKPYCSECSGSLTSYIIVIDIMPI